MMKKLFALAAAAVMLLSTADIAPAAQLARLKDAEISNGNLINANDIDAELNQLVNGHNNLDTRVGDIESSAVTLTGAKTFSSNIKVDGIDERSSGVGVTLDSVLHKDGFIRVPAGAGFTPTTNGDFGYDSTSNTYDVYVNGAAKSMLHTGSSVDDLNDVTITTPASGQVLKYNGSAWVNGTGGSLILLSTATASASATVDFTSSIDSTYDEYVLVGVGVVPATDAVAAYIRVSEDAGSTWKSAATDYKYSGYVYGISAGAGGSAGGATSAQIELSHGTTVGNASTKGFNFKLHFFKPSSTALHKTFEATPIGYETSGGDYYTLIKAGTYIGTVNAITGIRFLFSSGNISSGNFYLYGVKKS